MIIDNQNTIFTLAYQLVNDTQAPIYLTGKAGTGKTTFLKFVKANCTKNLVVVAPTGVAAINAGGVTMHSFFQLPFNPYIANAKMGFGLNANVVDRNTLLKNIRFNQQKRKIIEELELLIIDEVSMLRADMLDAIDTILRSFRKSNLPFGNVQMLFIGDLHQLPPVIVDSEKEIFEQHYTSPFFFDAHVLKSQQPLFVELKKIYRQTEETFINLLNKVRHNHLGFEDFEMLNERYKPTFKDIENKYITLTSHNHKADTINQRALQDLPHVEFEFKGEIKNDFSDKQLPTEMVLRLKKGAQVMFIKNDSSLEKKYYNGKLATVVELNKEEIIVQFTNSHEKFVVAKETWDNVSYTYDEDSNHIEENIIGQFIQYPLRLAWAITIHKSQGLTFENAIIDAGYSFAPGQVYVALSRCTTLDGLVLHSQITQQSLHNDNRIDDFVSQPLNEKELETILVEERKVYQLFKIQKLFNWFKLIEIAFKIKEQTLDSVTLSKITEAKKFVLSISEKTSEQSEIAKKFEAELHRLLQTYVKTNDATFLITRLEKAIPYFTQRIYDDLLKPYYDYKMHIASFSRIKRYQEFLDGVESSWWQKINELQKCTFNSELICKNSIAFTKHTKEEAPIKIKKEKGDSAKESLIYFESGKSIEEIAKLKNIAESTVEGHLSEFILKGKLGIEPFLNTSQLEKIKQCYIHIDDATLSNVKQKLNDEFSFGQLRMAVNYFLFTKEISLENKIPKK